MPASFTNMYDGHLRPSPFRGKGRLWTRLMQCRTNFPSLLLNVWSKAVFKIFIEQRSIVDERHIKYLYR